MSWAIPLEIMQITFPWKSSSFSLETEVLACMHVCAAVFVYVSWGHVSGSDGSAVKVQGELFLLRRLFPDWLH